MHIENLTQFKNICPTGAFIAFFDAYREDDIDFLLDTLAELEECQGAQDINPDQHAIWIEFFETMNSLMPLTFNLEQIEKDLADLTKTLEKI